VIQYMRCYNGVEVQQFSNVSYSVHYKFVLFVSEKNNSKSGILIFCFQ
jgi:hypothetical protein